MTRPGRRPLHRWALDATAVAVTLVAVLGAIGALPSGARGGESVVRLSSASAEPPPAPTRAEESGPAPATGATDAARDRARPPAVPSGSGAGRRIVFDQSDQRVWLLGERGRVQRTYLVSGSVTDNLAPGTYAVYSRSRWAVGVDDSGVMEYYVRFAHGARSTIGFHTIPTKDGVPLQTKRQLGTPQSHGCIRQRTADAIALWRFAPVGTSVVVVA